MPDVACRTAPPCPFALAACSIFKRPTPPSPPPTDVLLHPLQLHDPARHQGVCCGLCAGSHRRRALKTPQNDAAALVLHRGGVDQDDKRVALQSPSGQLGGLPPPRPKPRRKHARGALNNNTNTTQTPNLGRARRHRARLGRRDHPVPQDVGQPADGDRLHDHVRQARQRAVERDALLHHHLPLHRLLRRLCVRAVPDAGHPAPDR